MMQMQSTENCSQCPWTTMLIDLKVEIKKNVPSALYLNKERPFRRNECDLLRYRIWLMLFGDSAPIKYHSRTESQQWLELGHDRLSQDVSDGALNDQSEAGYRNESLKGSSIRRDHLEQFNIIY